MIITENLSKNFGNFEALKNISFEIKAGEIVGFLGQNGAGKTTLMRVLTTYLPATSGRVIIDGEDASLHTLSVRRKIGYLSETPALYLNMSVKEYLKFAAALKDVHHRHVGRNIDRVLEECDLREVSNKTISILSKGYRQRVGLAQAIINDPKLLILDEPTNGLDPIQILQVRNLIKDLRYKRTVILSTHILSEIEQLVSRVIVIKSGEIIKDALFDQLLQTYGTNLEGVFLKLHSPEAKE